MQANEGTVDRIIRVVAGIAMLAGAVGIGVGSVGGVVLLAVGGILLVTGAIGFCPLYRVLGISTCPAPKR